MSEFLQDRVVDLAALRKASAALDAQMKAAKDAFNLEHSVLIQSADIARTAVANAETAIKAIAIKAYTETQDAILCPGVTIKMFSTISYAPATAFEWAKEKKMALVPEALDKKAFEKIANASPLPFVTYGKEPRVQIASDLETALAFPEVLA